MSALAQTLADGPTRRGAQPRLGVEIRVRGRVQGVGFRPTVWRLARAMGLDGEVRNDAHGVLIHLFGPRRALDDFPARLRREAPPLAHIEAIETKSLAGAAAADGFFIVESMDGAVHTQITPDAAVCRACRDEIADPAARRFGYGLTNCTHCGPRLSIIRSVPYDRAHTTMAPFALCADCRREYENPADRRFHAEPTACPACGPVVRCEAVAGDAIGDDAIALAAARLRAGDIIALKGLGGYQLVCDATNAAAVARLRQGKLRQAKPFALMARDLAVVRRYCAVSRREARELTTPQAPILLLAARRPGRLPDSLAPGLATLGFMLPTTPLHVLLLRDFDIPLVATSGNVSDAPQIIDDGEAREQLGAIAGHILSHDRAIANRLDDSVVRVMAGKPRLLRRARGYAPAPFAMPPGFEGAPDLLALGGELKSTFCLLKDGQAIVSQHQGDLEHPAAFDDYRRSLALYSALFDHDPTLIAADLHPEYLSSKLASKLAVKMAGEGAVTWVQHHHAHIASCLCENGHPLAGPPVLGVALDGLGWGADSTFWGGEFLLADYRGFRRLACFKPVAMPGGTQAVREPWRNLYAHIAAAFGWEAFAARYSRLHAHGLLAAKPRATLDAMIASGLNAPYASSCGRVFDAAAAALGLCDGRQAYEGDAAARLESLADGVACDAPYSMAQVDADGFVILDPAPLWRSLFDDLAAGVGVSLIAARFHQGLGDSVADLAAGLAARLGVGTVALSGGCFQNRLLLEGAVRRLEASGLAVLTQARVPANDGGLSLGQAAVAAARHIFSKRTTSCV